MFKVCCKALKDQLLPVSKYSPLSSRPASTNSLKTEPLWFPEGAISFEHPYLC